MANIAYPTKDFLRQIMTYNSDDGFFYWNPRRIEFFQDKKQPAKHNCAIWNGKFAKKRAGCIGKDGYYKIRINDRLYLGHILAWVYNYGFAPNQDIDHINMNPSDNRLCNLRLATRSQNMANTKAHKDSLTGVKGVYFDKNRQKFAARIHVNGNCIQLGAFCELKEAKAAYAEASLQYFEEFRRSE